RVDDDVDVIPDEFPNPPPEFSIYDDVDRPVGMFCKD
ncbi:hypothetical protein scyTo_0017429, partial [Scyliorhinus torazame]|nr:hypothetical protein [Scyliorhinus torazame]